MRLRKKESNAFLLLVIFAIGGISIISLLGLVLQLLPCIAIILVVIVLVVLGLKHSPRVIQMIRNNHYSGSDAVTARESKNTKFEIKRPERSIHDLALLTRYANTVSCEFCQQPKLNYQLICPNCWKPTITLNSWKDSERGAYYRAKSEYGAISPKANSLIIESRYAAAQYLRQVTGIEWHVDHTVPLHTGGLHHEDNLQVVTAEWNIDKYAHHARRWEDDSDLCWFASAVEKMFEHDALTYPGSLASGTRQSLKISEIAQLAFENDLPDEWWISINGEVMPSTSTIHKVARHGEVHVMNAAKHSSGNGEWILFCYPGFKSQEQLAMAEERKRLRSLATQKQKVALEFIGTKTKGVTISEASKIIEAFFRSEKYDSMYHGPKYREYKWSQRHRIYSREEILSELFNRLQEVTCEIRSNVAESKRDKLLKRAIDQGVNEAQFANFLKNEDPKLFVTEETRQRKLDEIRFYSEVGAQMYESRDDGE